MLQNPVEEHEKTVEESYECDDEGIERGNYNALAGEKRAKFVSVMKKEESAGNKCNGFENSECHVSEE